MLQVDRLREELSGVTDVCGQVFDALQDARPDDESVVSLFGQYEQRIVTISRILDDSSARHRSDGYGQSEAVSGNLRDNRSSKRGESSAVKDRQSLISYLKAYA